MKRLILAGCAVIALSACQRETDADPNLEASAAEDAASAASASGSGSATDSASDASSGQGAAPGAAMGSTPEPSGDPIGAPPPINGSSGSAPAEGGGSVRPEMGARPPEDPTTGTLARPETPMPQTTPDGRPGL